MFDASLPEVDEFAALSDAALVDAASGWARAENAACARKLAVLAEVFRRRTGLEDADDRESWWVDPDAAVAAEVSAALNISQGLALAQTHRGVALADWLPQVAELFAAGSINDLLVRTIVSRTALMLEPELIAKVDVALAEQVLTWGPLSAKKTEQAIDALVVLFDPAALRQSRAASSHRDVAFGSPHDEPGLTSMWARTYAGDMTVLQRRIDELAHSVCDADPRTIGERRADAMIALATDKPALACGCEDPDCPAAGRDATPPINTVMHVVTDAATLVAASTEQPTAPAPDTTPSPPDPAAAAPGAAAMSPAPDTPARPEMVPTATSPTPPAFVMGGGIMPTPLLAATLARAKVREIRHPGADSAPEPRYRPSTKLAEFVQCRDLTCRFPGCDKPADVCDIDHTAPYPIGPTHASNLKCLCRFHHLMKTFCGWLDRQLPDGTVVWTAPTGHTYTTYPGSKHLFPTLCATTGQLTLPEQTADPSTDRGLKMPKRRHTRAQNKARAIAAERRLNDEFVAERNKPPSF